MRINQELTGEMSVYTQRYEQFEANALTQIQTLREASVYWRAESDQEARVAARNSEQSHEASRRCLLAEQTLRQNVVPNLPQNQFDLHHVIHRIEQEAMQHVQATEQKTESPLEQSSKHARLLNEEIYMRNVGLKIAEEKGDKAESERVRIELLLAQEMSALVSARHGQSELHEVAVQAQTKYVRSMQAVP